MKILNEGDSMKKRLGIFVFYDEAGIVDAYVEELLRGIMFELEKLIIVVNGEIVEESKLKLARFSDYIYQRENVGYDGGAYKDVFLKYISKEELEYWDEIVMFNDTFFAPIFPWHNVFMKMQNRDIDFWGLTKHEGGGKVLGVGEKIVEHIQGYFIVCRKQIIVSKYFKLFWENLKYPISYKEAIENFEINFTVYLKKHGFVGEAYIDCFEEKINTGFGEIVYLSKPEELLEKYRLPIVKKKAIMPIACFNELEKVLAYIQNSSDYDVNLIKIHFSRLCKENRIKPFNPLKLEKFYETHEHIYIYGNGKYGKNMVRYFEYRNWEYKGIIVSKKESNIDHNIFKFEDISFSQNDGVVLALGEAAFKEVLPVIVNKLHDKQLFKPDYGVAYDIK